MSTDAATSHRGSVLQHQLRVLKAATVYEFHKVSAFRTGFVVRELLRGIEKPLVMIAVYYAIFSSAQKTELNGFSYVDLVHYLLLVAVFEKLMFHNRGLELADQIFEGYMTKFMIMPSRYFTLALGRFTQYITLQFGIAGCFYGAGLVLVPKWWPVPVSWLAGVQTLILVLLGSYCMFLTYYIINCLAFWLDVVWTLLVGTMFITDFTRGVLIPVAMMPDSLQSVLRWMFPYWTLSAPIEIFIGRLGSSAFVEGLIVLLLSILALELLRRVVWARGLRQYSGAGM
jgi:ABC-2 type transport system permease protein